MFGTLAWKRVGWSSMARRRVDDKRCVAAHDATCIGGNNGRCRVVYFQSRDSLYGRPVVAHLSSFAGRATSLRYTRTAIAFHWLIAVLIVCGFSLGWVMTDIPGFTPTKLRYFSWHKWIGVTIFALVVLRILWRATHAAPPLPAG